MSTRAKALLVLVLGACSRQTSDGPGDGIPIPDLARVDPDVVQAVELAVEELKGDPDSPEAWGRLGARYMAHEFEREARACFRRAEELEPGSGVWPYRLGWSLFDERPEEALGCFERAREKLEDYAPLHEAMGTALVRLGRSAEARDAYRRASELDETSAHAETGLGQIALSSSDFETARVHLEAALARDPKHAEAHLALAQVYLALGRTEDAEHHAQRSRQLPPTTQRTDWLAISSAAPAGFRSRTQAGLRLERSGRLPQAAEQFRQALESNPSYEFVRLRLVGILVELDQRDEALTVLRAGLELDPSSRELALELRKLGGE